jgi:hypothetical protein
MITIETDFLIWLASGGVGGATITFLLKSWFETRLKNSIKHEYDLKLASLKSDIDKESKLVSALHDSYSQKNHIGHEYILKAINSLWTGMVALKDRKPGMLTVVDVLVEKEFGKGLGQMKIKTFSDITDEEISRLMSEDINRRSEDRLYTGEYLWSIFFAYRQLIARISIVIKKGREAKDVPIWWEDSICRQVIQSLCSESEYGDFSAVKIGKIDWMLSHVERKFLLAANKIITGEASLNMDIEQAEKIIKTIESSQRSQ